MRLDKQNKTKQLLRVPRPEIRAVLHRIDQVSFIHAHIYAGRRQTSLQLTATPITISILINIAKVNVSFLDAAVFWLEKNSNLH